MSLWSPGFYTAIERLDLEIDSFHNGGALSSLLNKGLKPLPLHFAAQTAGEENRRWAESQLSANYLVLPWMLWASLPLYLCP